MRPEAVAAMLPFLAEHPGNPSGAHSAARGEDGAGGGPRDRGRGARRAAAEVVFTAGGTEADNLAVKGGARAARRIDGLDAVVTTAFEHKGVLAAAHRLERRGFRVAEAAVTPSGVVDVDDLAARLDGRTAARVGDGRQQRARHDPAALGDRGGGARTSTACALHTDAVQAVPWVDVSSSQPPSTWSRSRVTSSGGRRASVPSSSATAWSSTRRSRVAGRSVACARGTVNVAGVVALATALRITHERRAEETARIAACATGCRRASARAVPDAFVNGDVGHRTAGHLHIGFPGVESEALLVVLDQEGLCAAAGSSCSSGATELSHVLAAMGMDRPRAEASIRLSLGYASTDADVDRALALVPAAVARLRAAACTAA